MYAKGGPSAGGHQVARWAVFLLLVSLCTAARQLDGETTKEDLISDAGHESQHAQHSQEQAMGLDVPATALRALKQYNGRVHRDRRQQRTDHSSSRDSRLNRMYDEREYRDQHYSQRASYGHTQQDHGQLYGSERASSRDSQYRQYNQDQRRDEGSYRQYNQDQWDTRNEQYSREQQRDQGYQRHNRDQRWRDSRIGWQQADQRQYNDGERVQYSSGHNHVHDHAADRFRGRDQGVESSQANRDARHCSTQRLNREEKNELFRMLDEADEWFGQAGDKVEAWLEEHGNLLSEWWGGMASKSERKDSEMSSFSGAIVKVYWHEMLIENPEEGSSNGELAWEQIDAQMKVLNAAFEPAGIQFVLELVQPWYVDPETFYSCSYEATNGFKEFVYNGTATDLFIYTRPLCHPDNPDATLFGYATYPSIYQQQPQLDGVVLNYQVIPGGSLENNNLGMVAVHEVGHWLALEHTFEGEGCDDEQGDGVADTAVEAEATYGCPTEVIDTCEHQPGVDNIHNFMAYTDDTCINHFTAGQIELMHKGWKLRVKASMES